MICINKTMGHATPLIFHPPVEYQALSPHWHFYSFVLTLETTGATFDDSFFVHGHLGRTPLILFLYLTRIYNLSIRISMAVLLDLKKD